MFGVFMKSLKHIMCMEGENKGIVGKYEDKGFEYKDAHRK